MTFITTAIPFVNARPHLGFAYELVLADILARHRRRRGDRVLFTTGTDDNSEKNVRAAGTEPVAEFVARNSEAFRALSGVLGISNDDFLATSRDPRHRPTVKKLWRACSHDLYRKVWRGRYCVGCEAFVDDYVEACPEHPGPLETIEEENWFFRLSAYAARIREAIETGELEIIGDAARAETLAFLRGEVRDLSVSRSAERSGGWGIPVPDDPTQIIYVWFDALANYLSLVEGREELWTDVTHVVGKGITRFHTVYWPAFLLSAGLPLPARIAVHGYLTIDGQKIAKSGRSVAVEDFVTQSNVSAVRWYFARGCRTRVDSDASITAIRAAHDRDLADRLGNLVQRCTTLAAKVGLVRDDSLRPLAEALPARIDAALARFLPDEAVAAAIAVLDAANRSLEERAPWKLPPEAAAQALYAPLEAARFVAGELEPFVPAVAETVFARLGQPSRAPHWGLLDPEAPILRGPPLIPRLG
ncbi:MAG TPA: methionine--tRNA ligase [Kofleriaceae bacterium]